MKRTFTKSLLTAAVVMATSSASAINLYDKDGTTLDLNGIGFVGHFSSDETYGNADSSPSWQEAAVTYGLYGNKALENVSLYGGLAAITTWVDGDGDAAGNSSGSEGTETDIEEAFIGITGNGWDFSFGQQGFHLGDGFLIWDDGLNLGDVSGFAPELNRGGTYWLGGSSRKSFGETAILRLGQEEGVRGDVFWLKSDNKAQAETELAGINVEHISDVGTFGASYIKGLDVTPSGALGGALDNTHRDGQKTVSVRYQGNAGVENLFLSTEFATQDQGDATREDGDAWYVEAGWTFADVAWSPMVSYRYSTFDDGFDPLFFAFSRGYGTWFQGEVAGNYAGPYNTGADIHHLSVVASPSETLRVGAHYFKFEDTINPFAGPGSSNDADEINLWAEWVVNDNLIINPLVSFYTPDDASSVQGNTDTNTYFQVIAIVPF